MTISTEAIEAAMSALCDIGLHSREGGLDGPFGDRFVEGPVDQVITTILTAARPHIEAELRAEIEAEAVRLENTTHLHVQDQNAARAFIAGVRHAAQIARGEHA